MAVRLDEFLSPRIDVEINRIAKEESISASDIFSIPSEGKRNAKKRPAFAKRGLSQQIVVLQPDPSFITSSESSSKGEPSDQKKPQRIAVESVDENQISIVG